MAGRKPKKSYTLNSEQIAMVIAEYNTGQTSVKALSEDYFCSPTAIRNILHGCGDERTKEVLEDNKRGWNKAYVVDEEQAKEIVEFYNNNLTSIYGVSTKFRKGQQSVVDILRKYGCEHTHTLLATNNSKRRGRLIEAYKLDRSSKGCDNA